LALAVACAPASVATKAPTATPTYSPTSTPLSPTPTETPVPSAVEGLALSTVEGPTPLHNSSFIIHPCSPLSGFTLADLPGILLQRFKTPSPSNDAEHPERLNKDDGHHGADLGYYSRDGKPFTGTPVLSALDGRIAAIIHDRPPYGSAFIVETPFEQIPPQLIQSQSIPAGNSLYVLYAHLQNLQTFNLQQEIACGQPLAETGMTGMTDGPHLHFETRWGPPGVTFTSMAFYRADATPEELAAYEKWRMSGVFHLFDGMELLKTR